jgi:hypothetical protein
MKKTKDYILAALLPYVLSSLYAQEILNVTKQLVATSFLREAKF